MEKVIELFRKIISSLICINKKTIKEKTKDRSEEYLLYFINEYENFRKTKNIYNILMNINVVNIINFCNECYEQVEIFDYAEDLEYGLKELIEKINKERK